MRDYYWASDAREFIDALEAQGVTDIEIIIRADYWPEWVQNRWQARGDMDIERLPDWLKVDWEASAVARGLIPVQLNGGKYYAAPRGVDYD